MQIQKGNISCAKTSSSALLNNIGSGILKNLFLTQVTFVLRIQTLKVLHVLL